MFGLDTSTLFLVLLVVALIVVIVLWMRGDPEIESPRSQMGMLEDALRRRGFNPLLPMVRNFGKYKEDEFLSELQKLLVPFMSDKEFSLTWLRPMLLANLGMIINDPDLFLVFDVHLRKEYGYRLKPIHHVEYGARPEIRMHATAEEQDVCFKENVDVELSKGQKVYVPLEEKPSDPS